LLRGSSDSAASAARCGGAPGLERGQHEERPRAQPLAQPGVSANQARQARVRFGRGYEVPVQGEKVVALRVLESQISEGVVRVQQLGLFHQHVEGGGPQRPPVGVDKVHERANVRRAGDVNRGRHRAVPPRDLSEQLSQLGHRAVRGQGDVVGGDGRPAGRRAFKDALSLVVAPVRPVMGQVPPERPQPAPQLRRRARDDALLDDGRDAPRQRVRGVGVELEQAQREASQEVTTRGGFVLGGVLRQHGGRPVADFIE